MAPTRIFLTGANGFLGSHILRQLLLKPNISIRAVVRSAAKIEAIKSDFSAYLDKLDFFIVPDITVPNAFHQAFSETTVPFDAVIHTASPFLYKVITSNLEFLEPAVKGTTQILNAIKDVAPSVKRIVITSSFAAVADLAHPESMSGKTYTEEDWNPIKWSEALDTEDKNTAYQASKKFAEEAAWDFLDANQPSSFDIVTICPPMIYGPLAHTIHDISALNQSNSRIYKLFINSSSSAPLPPDALHLYADPREVAAAHIAALYTEKSEAKNQRFIISGGQVSSQQISDILRAKFPELEGRTPVGRPGVSSLPERAYAVNVSKAERVLGIGSRPLEETIGDLGRQLLDIEKIGVN